MRIFFMLPNGALAAALVLGLGGCTHGPHPAAAASAGSSEEAASDPDPAADPADDTATVVPGSLEKSNVNATKVLVDMVSAQRLFEMRTKLVAAAKDNDEKSTALMALPA